MRDLILLRGAPGSGKSTWVNEHHLEPYTISSDAVRLMFSCPDFDPTTGKPHISQRNDSAVWKFIEDIMDLRMRTGQFIILDAQNIDLARWTKLAKKHRYRMWYKQFNVSEEECLRRNAARPIILQVPEHVIMLSCRRLADTTIPDYVQPVTDDIVAGTMQPTVVDQYRCIHFCGDVHSCYVPLKHLYDDTDGFREDELFVFVGDYLDRGTKPKETLELLISQRNKPNMIFLEGNHKGEKRWSNNQIDEIRSPEFLHNTMSKLEGVDKRAVKEWCAKWQELAYLSYNGKRYFVTHAGIGYMPDHIRWIPSQIYIRGGEYEEDVDREWCQQCYGHDLIQIHGHRNFYGYGMDEADESINLNSPVEFGADWRVCTISKDTIEYRHYPNPDHQPINQALAEFMLEPNKIIGDANG